MNLKPDVSGVEVFKYFKRLEGVVKKYFKNVTQFTCEKKFHSNIVYMSFFSDGTDFPKTVKLLFNAQSI